ncbi:hypothetical protein MLD38_022887 [Melastoma candidum]|uniref:Uncharacterized protein n=1 Tax=Melastoma candidum TaxID=119954 RepID=A0ACB9QLB9_9MYRT|nr:hypothetical protein MLD38_022887 [Melastoma candidum]
MYPLQRVEIQLRQIQEGSIKRRFGFVNLDVMPCLKSRQSLPDLLVQGLPYEIHEVWAMSFLVDCFEVSCREIECLLENILAVNHQLACFIQAQHSTRHVFNTYHKKPCIPVGEVA